VQGKERGSSSSADGGDSKNADALDVQDTNYKLSAMYYAGWRVPKLLSLGANVALKDKDGFTALMLTCKEKKEEVATLLMEATKSAGALDLQDTNYKLSALLYASSSGLESTVEKLLSLGAKVDARDSLCRTSLLIACALRP
jgi:ankyrin repeat protein